MSNIKEWWHLRSERDLKREAVKGSDPEAKKEKPRLNLGLIREILREILVPEEKEPPKDWYK